MNKYAAFRALNTFANARAKLVDALRDAGYVTVEDTHNIIVEWACEKTGCTFTIAESSGKVMLNSKHKKYEAAKTTVRDVKLMVMGTTRHAESKRTEPTKVRISAAERAAFAALVKACGDVKRLRTVVKALAV